MFLPYLTEANTHTHTDIYITLTYHGIMVFQDVELVLRESTAKWKIVVGHHAIKSVGHHGDTQELVKLLLPILQVKKS